MIAKLLISSTVAKRIEEIEKILSEAGLKHPHPDVLYFPADSKLGIEQAREIKDFSSLKPYQSKGRAVILEDASNLTIEAQNAILKTLEEPPEDAILILAAPSDAKLLPTVISRCQIVTLEDRKYNNYNDYKHYTKDLEHLLKADISERFEYVEKLKDREEFLHTMVYYFHQNLPSHISSSPREAGGNTSYVEFLKELLQAGEWANQNVNIRAILEYLMLIMPQKL